MALLVGVAEGVVSYHVGGLVAMQDQRGQTSMSIGGPHHHAEGEVQVSMMTGSETTGHHRMSDNGVIGDPHLTEIFIHQGENSRISEILDPDPEIDLMRTVTSGHCQEKGFPCVGLSLLDLLLVTLEVGK